MVETERAQNEKTESTSEATQEHERDTKKVKTMVLMKGVPVPEVLKFTSWWDEDKEESSLGNGSSAGGGLKRRYISLKFYTTKGTFDVSKLSVISSHR